MAQQKIANSQFFSAHIFISNRRNPVQFKIKQVVKDKKCISKCYKSEIVVVMILLLQIQTTKFIEENVNTSLNICLHFLPFKCIMETLGTTSLLIAPNFIYFRLA